MQYSQRYFNLLFRIDEKLDGQPKNRIPVHTLILSCEAGHKKFVYNGVVNNCAHYYLKQFYVKLYRFDVWKPNCGRKITVQDFRVIGGAKVGGGRLWPPLHAKF